MTLDQLVISLNSSYSFLYESVLRLATDILLAIFNEGANSLILEAFMTAVNAGFAGTSDRSEGTGNNYSTDQRWIKFEVHQGYLSVYSPGRLCYEQDRRCKGWSAAEIVKFPEYKWKIYQNI